MKLRGDRGSAAVEFALVLPILILVLVGTIDFGRAYNTRLTLTHAAREGVRVWALGGTASDTEARVKQTAQGLTGITVTPSPAAACDFGRGTQITVSVPFTYLTPLISQLAPGTSTMSATGVMRCGG